MNTKHSTLVLKTPLPHMQTKHSNQMGQHNVARAFKKVVKINSYGRTTMYRVGEYVALQDHQSEGTEWIVQITALVVYGQVNNAYAQFFNDNYFRKR